MKIFFSFGPGLNMSVDQTESGPRPSKAHFHGPTVSVRSGPVDRTLVGLCGTLFEIIIEF